VSYILRTHSNHQVDTREVPDSSLLIGRAGGAQLRLPEEAVEFLHARIDRIEGQYVLSDESRITGTYVNGIKIQKKILADGDRIMIGVFVLVAGLEAASGDLTLDITPATAEPQISGKSVDRTAFDYAGAYALHHRLWNKTVLTVVFVLVSAALLLWPVRAGRKEIFRAGNAVSGHALFANQCDRCHQPWRGPSESRCQECHGTQIHHPEQAFVPSCLMCHAEHHEQPALSRVASRQCLVCHAALKTRSGQAPRFEKRITDFTADHPEFAITVKTGAVEKRLRLSDTGARQADSTKIKLNHALHLKRNLQGPKGPVRLFCKDCHVPSPDGNLMLPVSYEAQCRDCHQLKFDSRLPGRVVPHATPEIVEAYLKAVYAEPTGQTAIPAPRVARDAETRLFANVCGECHHVNPTNLPLPVIEKSDIPDRWFQHARFSHRSHRVIECNGCHTRAARSRKTEDVLIPGMEICQGCHRKDDAGSLWQRIAAPTECITCHSYHDRGVNPDWDGPLSVHQFLEGEESRAEPATMQPYSIRRFLEKLAAGFDYNANSTR
jgi:hypothetical protein